MLKPSRATPGYGSAVGEMVDPGSDVLCAVADVPADPEVRGTAPLVPPVREGAERNAQVIADLLPSQFSKVDTLGIFGFKRLCLPVRTKIQ